MKQEAELDVFMLELHPVVFEDEDDEDEEDEEDDLTNWQHCHSVNSVGQNRRNCRGRSRLLHYSTDLPLCL